MSKRKVYDYTDKEYNIRAYTFNTLNKISTMFKYHNLPDTMPSRNLEKLLMNNGFACIAKVDNELYAFWGGLGGESNVYLEPTVCTVANPALQLSKDFVIDKDCVIIRNDSYMQGMLPVINRYSTLLAETDITTIISLINTRLIKIFSAGDSQTKESANQYLQNIVQGKLGIIADNTFIESLKINSSPSQNQLFNELITLNQYLKASLTNEIGLNANTQLKKERLVSAEVEVNNEGIYPITDDMLNQRKEGIEKVNAMFGTNIEVEYNSSWDYRIYNGMSIHNTSDEIDLSDVLPADEPSGDEPSGDVSRETISDEADETSGDESADETSGDEPAGDVSRETISDEADETSGDESADERRGK